MVQVVSRVLDSHVLEQSAICSKNVVRPGRDLLSVPLYPSIAPVLQPRIATWEELQTHIHHISRREFFRNGFRPRCSLRILQIGINIAGHQDLGPVRLNPDGCYNVLYGWVVTGVNISLHYMKPPPLRYQLEADYVRVV